MPLEHRGPRDFTASGAGSLLVSKQEVKCRRERLLEVFLQARTERFILGLFYVAALQGDQYPYKPLS